MIIFKRVGLLLLLVAQQILADAGNNPEKFRKNADGLYELVSVEGDIIVKEADTSRPFDIFDPYVGYPGKPIVSSDASFAGKGILPAFTNTQNVMKHFKSIFGLDGIDGKGSPLEVILYDDDSAQFVEKYVLLGRNLHDENRKAVTEVIDSVAHEIFHGVIKSSSGLDFDRLESAGLNEGLADIMGVYAKYKIEGILGYTFGVGFNGEVPMRSLADPAKFHGADHISKIDLSDILGHRNGGIIALAFYLFSNGGSHPRLGGPKVQGVGIDLAAKIFFEMATKQLKSDSTFADAREASLVVAKNFGEDVVQSLNMAWDQVGLK